MKTERGDIFPGLIESNEKFTKYPKAVIKLISGVALG